MDSSPVIQVPLPCGPTSNATRELDDLMASLSDFKVSPTPATMANITSLLLVESNEESSFENLESCLAWNGTGALEGRPKVDGTKNDCE